jgi:CDP-diacylglycerol--glycerol-3-phosphate 3-phosphatidyltransferase
VHAVTTLNRPRLLNVPNAVTSSRLVLAVVLFAALGWKSYRFGLIVFLIAAATDWFDGYWARRYGQVTQLGRILDPFADKLIICGTFVYLAAAPRLLDGTVASGIATWMAVLILARELGVTALRSFIEQQGGDFSAKWVGKWKMVAQCAAAALSIAQLEYLNRSGTAWATEVPPWHSWSLLVAVWTTIALTVYSGVDYLLAAVRVLRQSP